MFRITCASLLAATAALLAPLPAHAACCYFSAKNADILQPAQKAFLTWDPVEKVETFTVQPKFEGNALDFGKHLAVYTIMKKREVPHSKLLPMPDYARLFRNAGYGLAQQTKAVKDDK